MSRTFVAVVIFALAFAFSQVGLAADTKGAETSPAKMLETKKDTAPASETLKASAEFRDGGAYVRVDHFGQNFRNITTSMTAADLEKLGIRPGDKMELTLGNKTVQPLYAKAFGDVPKGEWVALVTQKGVMFARNFDHARDALDCKEDSVLFVKPLKAK